MISCRKFPAGEIFVVQNVMCPLCSGVWQEHLMGISEGMKPAERLRETDLVNPCPFLLMGMTPVTCHPSSWAWLSSHHASWHSHYHASKLFAVPMEDEWPRIQAYTPATFCLAFRSTGLLAVFPLHFTVIFCLGNFSAYTNWLAPWQALCSHQPTDLCLPNAVPQRKPGR